MPTRLSLSDALFPVQCFFNAVSDDAFPRMVASLVSGVGFGANACDCELPGDLDPGDEPFAGVRFSVHDETVVLPLEALRPLLEQAVAA